MKTIIFKNGLKCFYDDREHDIVSKHNWWPEALGHTWYAKATVKKPNGKKTSIYMHRLILNPGRGKRTDHINMNGLDNRWINLRSCSHSQNLCNVPSRGKTSKFKGVHFEHNGFVASISFNKNKKYLGRFKTAEEAALAYDKSAREIHGEFARINFPGTV